MVQYDTSKTFKQKLLADNMKNLSKLSSTEHTW